MNCYRRKKICKKCGKEDVHYLIRNNCQKGEPCEFYGLYKCEQYTGPDFLCYKCGNESNTISWLTVNSCHESGAYTSLIAYQSGMEKDVDELEIDKWMLKKGNMERIDNQINGFYDYENPNWAALCIIHLERIIEAVPEYKNRIISKVLKHEEGVSFNKKQGALVDFFILELLENIYPELTDEKEISDYVLKKQKSINRKTKKLSKKLIKKYGLK